MKKLFSLTFLMVVCLTTFADQTLHLTWEQPLGWHSTLYSSTNLDGTWSQFSTSSPPVDVQPTNQVAFFQVIVAPSNTINGAMIYNTDPNGESLIPEFPLKPAVCYSLTPGANGYCWDTNSQIWF